MIKHMMLTKVLLTALCICTSAALADAQPEGKPKEDLSSLVKHGLRTSFAIRAQKLKYLSTRADRFTAWTNLLPTISVSGGRSSSTSESLSGTEKQKSSSLANTLGLTASWTIWNQYQNVRDIEVARLNERVEEISNLQTGQNYVISLVNSYLSYLLLLQREEILKTLLDQSQWAEDQAKALVGLGVKTRLDVLEAEIEVKNTQRDLLETQQAIPVAHKQLLFLLNEPESSEEAKKLIQKINLETIEPYFMSEFQQKLSEIRTSLVERTTSFLLTNPDLQSSSLRLDIARKRYRQAQLSYLPTTSVSMTWGRDLNGYVQPGLEDYEKTGFDSWGLSVNFSWTFWDWFSTYRSIDNQRRDYVSSQISHSERIFQKNNELQNLIDQYDTIVQSLETSELILQKAEEQQQYSRELYKLGKRTMIEVQKANTSLSQARLDLNERRKTKYLTAASILQQWKSTLLPAGHEVDWTEEPR